MSSERLAKALANIKKRGGHSPAGYRYLQSLKKKKKTTEPKTTEPTYFNGKAFERPTIEERLRKAGISTAQINKLKGKK